jgi:radical SAM superfamily enzyme YgiQ (UPF0313 family)
LDLLLTHGYHLDEDPHEREIMRPYPPLGLLYISSHLKRRGLDVRVFDTTFRSAADLEAYVARERPPVVGLAANLMTRRTVLRAIRTCKASGARVVVGGPEPASYPEEYLAAGADVVVDGEGEVTMEELVPHLLERGSTGMELIAGLIYREAAEGGRLVRTPPRRQIADLDGQPYPDRDSVDVEAYLRVWREHHGQGSVSLITARGCPYRCTWCSHGVFGYTHRRRSPGNVADELQRIVERYGPDMVWYADDVFTIHPGWIHAYARELKRRGLRVPFETISREDRLDEDMVRTLAEMGCFRLWIGSESGSQRILDAMKRRTDAGRVREMVRLLQRHGIEAGLFIMLGFEGEEIEDLEATVEHLKTATPDRFLTTVAYPIKGTPYHEQVSGRIAARRPWSEGSDRDLTVRGRRSPRFYRLATRWMVHEVAWSRLRRARRPDLLALLKACVGARVARLGLWLARHEVDTGAPVS